ncbi:MAG: hypothetical protein EBS93_08895 [Chitinophagia bacterium]|nr:hypothetical protein [Chitinophagia bacterium]NCA30819.1 hypothetical protein [Chitinophagia bacterium]
MTWDGTFKYAPMNPDKINTIMEAYKHEQIYEYIQELYSLIHYQRKIIDEQRTKIVALQHKEAWKRYDLPEKSFQVGIDKPPKDGNMSC